MHWPDWPKNWFFDEFTVENRKDKDDGTWEKIGPRNEAFDLYAYAALLKLGLNRTDWANPRHWAMPWDGNHEILSGEEGDGEPGPIPSVPAGRRVRFRMR